MFQVFYYVCMHDSRKNLLSISLNTILTVFTLASIILLVILIINKNYIYIIPLALSLIASIFSFVVNVIEFVFPSFKKQKLHVLVEGQEYEKSSSRIKIGDHVVLYPRDHINFVGKVTKGEMLVDESHINGIASPVRKTIGSSVIRGTVVVESSAVVEVTELGSRYSTKIKVKETKFSKIINLSSLISSSILLVVLLNSFLFDIFSNTNTLDNVSKASIASLPCLVNIVLTIFFFIASKKCPSGMKVKDFTVFDELSDVDVVCLDKTGTLTTGRYQLFKTVTLSQSSLNAISLDSNRAFEQTVSNIVRSTKESGGYFDTLNESFVYEVTKIIEQISPIRVNGMYSAITIRSGYTYALGYVDNFELTNAGSIASIVDEYVSSGYTVLALVESKKPLNQGLIDGKSTAIGLIILQEEIRLSAINLIKYCQENNKQIKIISGDKLSTVIDICRKTGLDCFDKSVSLKEMNHEDIANVVSDYVVFADATSSRKSFIVSQLQKEDHIVAYIGDGDNDTQALKTANVAISLTSGTIAANKCSHAVIEDNFEIDKPFINYSKHARVKMENVLAILLSQVAFSLFYSIVFSIARYVDVSIYNPFEYNHLLIWTIFGLIAPSIIILVEKTTDSLRYKNFFRNFVANSSLLIVIVGVFYILELIQYNGFGYFSISPDINELHQLLPTSLIADNLSYLALGIGSLFIVYNHFSPCNKYRLIAFISILVIPVAYAVLLAFSVDNISFITQVETKELNPIHYIVLGIVSLFLCSLYLFVLDIVSIVKGEKAK